MADRMSRLAQFVLDRIPPDGEAVQLLCEDHSGTYTLPFPCRWAGHQWINVKTSQAIEAQVLGWRERPAPTTRRCQASVPSRQMQPIARHDPIKV